MSYVPMDTGDGANGTATLSTGPDASKSRAILERFARTRARAQAMCDRSAELERALATSLRDAERTRCSVAEQRRAMLLGRTPVFLVCGFVEEDPVEARWVPGHGLMCPPQLLERAELVVGLGEMFSSSEDDETGLRASLDDPTAAMLTVMRAMSRVQSLEMGR